MSYGVRFRIKPVRSVEDLESAKRLFAAYASSLEIDLAFQNFQSEMEALPDKYAPPGGELLLAYDLAGNPAGCVGLRPIAPAGCCEMKRLYVSSTGRGLGIGKALIDAVILEATRIGYREMKLDTLPSMIGAISLYKKAGFNLIEPYYETPVVGTIFLGRLLTV
jgi:ribosomal protein S18 acetylase RimI-like enzyme